jgi:hypothetical protein
MFIFLTEARQLILDDCFNFFLRILLHVQLGFDGLVLCGGRGMVFQAEVFNASTSTWVVGWSIGFVAIVQRFVDGCGCSVCGMCVAWVVVWAVVGTCSSSTWDEPSVGSSFPDLFLGGILWVFFRAHKWWASLLGLNGRRLSSTNEGETKMMSTITGHLASGTNILANQFAPEQGGRAGLFIVGAQ